MQTSNLWCLTPDQRSNEEVELALLGMRTGDQIVRNALEGFSADLEAILHDRPRPSRPSHRPEPVAA